MSRLTHFLTRPQLAAVAFAFLYFFWLEAVCSISVTLHPATSRIRHTQTQSKNAPKVSARVFVPQNDSFSPTTAASLMAGNEPLRKKSLVKRLRLSKSIKVVIHYHCQISGLRSETFEWEVTWYDRLDNVYYTPIQNIDYFPRENQYWNTNHYPHSFRASWVFDDCSNYHVRDYLCQHSYSGWFEGQVGKWGINVEFVDMDLNGWSLPTIEEQCTTLSSAYRSAHLCFEPREVIVNACEFRRADVSWPEFAVHQ